MSDKPRVYAFIDSQNLNLGVKSSGWQIDYQKLRLYLTNKYGVNKAFMFIGMMAGNERLYKKLQDAGFTLVFKPTVHYNYKGKRTVKGNVDAELVLHSAAIEFKNYDKAIIITGDGDFACLLKFLRNKGKLLHVLTPTRKYSMLIRPYSSYITVIDNMRSSLEIKTTGFGGRSKP